jgi:basic membrane lipoprotein Med (substrate-binding protein (PBP1-ABC) superfamily)
MQSRTIGAGVLALVLVGTLAACGGGGKKASSTPPASTTNASTTATGTTVTTATTTAEASSGGGSFADAKSCSQLASLAAKVQQSVQPTGNGSVDLAREADALRTLADRAPDAIKGDLRTFADAFTSFAKAYADSGFKAGSTPTAAQIAKFSRAAQKLATPKVQAAMTHLESWGRTHCGGLTSTTP